MHECVWYYSLLAGNSLASIWIRSTTCRFMLTAANNLAIKPGLRGSCTAVLLSFVVTELLQRGNVGQGYREGSGC